MNSKSEFNPPPAAPPSLLPPLLPPHPAAHARGGTKGRRRRRSLGNAADQVLRAITGRKTKGRSVATAGGARELQKLQGEDLQGRGRRMGAVTPPDLASFL
jgi:hypothetical protein